MDCADWQRYSTAITLVFFLCFFVSGIRQILFDTYQLSIFVRRHRLAFHGVK